MHVIVKLIGAVFLTAAATLVGVVISDRLKNRINALNWYLRSTQIIADKIRFSAIEIRKITEALPCYDNYIKICEPFKVKAQNPFLNEGDASLINAFFAELGMGDTTEQINICNMYAKELEARYTLAQKEYSEKSKPIKSLGFFAGLGAAIVLL